VQNETTQSRIDTISKTKSEDKGGEKGICQVVGKGKVTWGQIGENLLGNGSCVKNQAGFNGARMKSG